MAPNDKNEQIAAPMPQSASPYPAKKLILNLVKEAQQPISAQVMVRMAELFSVEANNVRVTLNRLTKQGFLDLTERGIYVLGPSAQHLAERQSAWRCTEDKVCSWSGKWIAIYTAHLGRRDRKVLRQRQRATEMLGFREFYQGLLVRPDNLVASLPEVTQQLFRLGLEAEACVFCADGFNEEARPASETLWPIDDINARYRDNTEEMLGWRQTFHDKPLDVAARECFLIGDRVLRDIAFDPLLPEEMVDQQARAQMVSTMADFDDLGKSIWRELIARFMADLPLKGS